MCPQSLPPTPLHQLDGDSLRSHEGLRTSPDKGRATSTVAPRPVYEGSSLEQPRGHVLQEVVARVHELTAEDPSICSEDPVLQDREAQVDGDHRGGGRAEAFRRDVVREHVGCCREIFDPAGIYTLLPLQGMCFCGDRACGWGARVLLRALLAHRSPAADTEPRSRLYVCPEYRPRTLDGWRALCCRRQGGSTWA